MPSRRGFAAICFFPGNPPMFALEKRYNKTYGRRLGQDISDFLHMELWIGRYLIIRELFSSEILCFLTFPSQPQIEVRTQWLLLENFLYASFPRLPIIARGEEG